jgi:hypothetical protein
VERRRHEVRRVVHRLGKRGGTVPRKARRSPAGSSSNSPAAGGGWA